MFTFSSFRIDDIVIEQPDKIARNCKCYEVKKDGGLISSLYGGDKFSFINIENDLVRIDRKSFFLAKATYEISNHKTNIHVGEFEFLQNEYECIFSLVNDKTYFFHRNSNQTKLLKPKTWSSFEHAITSDTDTILLSKNSDKENFEGTIETTNEDLILPMMCGIFIIEEQSRLSFKNAS